MLATGLLAVAFGVYCIANRAFPRWMTGAWLWPLDRITPRVVVFEGCASTVVGGAALAYPFVVFAPDALRPALTTLTVAALMLSLALVGTAVWISRRPAEGRP
jgi:hypothetical protein